MKIIILGAGQVGATLAENLASESNDITVVDIDRFRIRALQDRLDIRTVHGHASYPEVFAEHCNFEPKIVYLAKDNSKYHI